MNNSLIDIGQLSKPVTTLIKKISNAAGVFYEPTRIRKRAEAEGDAMCIKAYAEVKVMDIKQRAAHRAEQEQIRHQQNIESITAQAIPLLNEAAKPDEMDDGWIANFFDKSKNISDKEMQSLWARILAGEANKPKSFSRRTVNFLSDIDKEDAELFTKVCGFAGQLNNRWYLLIINDSNSKIHADFKINDGIFLHLQSIGLLELNIAANFQIDPDTLERHLIFDYYGRKLKFVFQKRIPIGRAIFTQIGRELVPICGSKPVNGFFDYMKKYWDQYSPKEIS